MAQGHAPHMDEGPIPKLLREEIRKKLDALRGPGHYGELTQLARRVGCERQNLDKIANGTEWSAYIRPLCEALGIEYVLYAGVDDMEYRLLLALKHVRAAEADPEHFVASVEKKSRDMVAAMLPIGDGAFDDDHSVDDETSRPALPAPSMIKKPDGPGRPGRVRARSSGSKTSLK